MRRRRAAGSTRLACALRGRFFCFLLSVRAIWGGFPRPGSRCGLFATAEDARAARGPAGAEMGRIFHFLLPRRSSAGFATSRGLSAQIAHLCWVGRYGAGSPGQRRQRALGGRISDKANINLRKTLPRPHVAIGTPAPRSRQIWPACAQRAADPATTAAAPRPGSRRPCRLWAADAEACLAINKSTMSHSFEAGRDEKNARL